jgi:hypothetical protein
LELRGGLRQSASLRIALSLLKSPGDRGIVRGIEMDKFTVLTGVAAPLRIINVDTDMIIPKQYLKTIKSTGLGTGDFA